MSKISKIFNLQDSKNFQFRKFEKFHEFAIWNIRKICDFQNSKYFKFGKFQKFVIWRIQNISNS